MKIPRDVIPEMSQMQVVESGLYPVTVAEFEKAETGEPRAGAATPAGCLLYKVQFRTTDDVPLFDQYYVGHADDPLAEDPETWKRFPAQRLGALLNAAGVTEDDDAKIARIIKGKKLTLDVVKEKDNKGTDRNNIKNFYSVAGAPRTPTPGAKKPAATKPGAPSAASPPITPIRKAAPPPPAEVEQEEAVTTEVPAGNGADVQETQETTAPPPIKKKAPTAKEATIPCELCDPIQHIPRSQYKGHIGLHEQEEE